MTKTKSTKRALLLSALSLLMCVSMLIGSTFAWFTDSVTSGLNKIQSGNLDVKLEHSYGFYDGPLEEVDSSTELFKHNVDGEEILWEPGVSMVEYFTVTNAGSLALKFKFNLIADNATKTADGKTLLDVLQVEAMQVATNAEHLNSLNSTNIPDATVHTPYELNDFGYETYLLPGEHVVFAVHVTWEPTDHDNDYNVPGGLQLDLGVMLVATQYTYEKDSFNDQYDVDAEYPVIPKVDTWDGTADTSWYNDTDTEFVITTAEQLAGMNQLIGEGVTFEGKTIKLGADLDMSGADWFTANESFMGILDGQGHTISGLHYEDYVGDYGSRMGLFGHIENGTVKNLVMDSISFQAYQSYGGIICGGAYGDCTFENITLTNCVNEMYNRGSAGIVGLGYSDSNYTFTNINIDSSNRIGAYWGTPDAACGGLIGYYWVYGDDDGSIFVKDSYLAQEMNCYNDVVANYQWYAYRLSGMLVGYVQTTGVEEGTTYPVLDDLTCENVTVEYGDWAEYYYCEMEKCGHPSYAKEDEYKFTRLVKISSVDEIHEEKNDWNDNFVLLDGENATCYHVVRDADTRKVLSFHSHTAAEDNVCVKLTFDQLYGGDKGVYGETEHDGVTVIYPNN